MTDKEQIIIDGVDVSSCKGLKYKPDGIKKPICLEGGIRGIYRSCLCEKNQNCHFKQLTRKAQECEALKKRNEDNERFYLIQYAKKDSEVLDLTHKLNVKTQECEGLKEKLEKFYTLAGEPIEYFLDHYTNLCEDFLLDDRDEDDNTIPILEQIRDRLEDKDTLEEENTRYRKALEEIEGIIKQTKQQVFCQHCAWYNTDGCDPSDKICGDFIKILDIIDKAKGEK